MVVLWINGIKGKVQNNDFLDLRTIIFLSQKTSFQMVLGGKGRFIAVTACAGKR